MVILCYSSEAGYSNRTTWFTVHLPVTGVILYVGMNGRHYSHVESFKLTNDLQLICYCEPLRCCKDISKVSEDPR